MDALDIRKLVKESMEHGELLCESSSLNGLRHMYEDYGMTFGEMRQIFRDIFSGKTVLTEKTCGLDIAVTYRDGRFMFARNKSTLRDPVPIENLPKQFDGESSVKEAYVMSARDLQSALNSIGSENLNRIFSNGQKFARLKIIYPPCENVLDYGNRCILQLDGVDSYDSNFNRISEDEDARKWLFGHMRNHKALKQEMFEIEEPNILRMKDSISANKALESLMEDFNKVIDGYSTRCTIRDWANERMRRYIINVCNHNDIDVERDCPFVRELADRIGNFSGRRPTKQDICTFAKRAGVNVHSDGYRSLMEELELKRDAVNEEIMRPVENLVMKAGVYLLRNLRGFMASDPNKCSQRLVSEMERVIGEVESDNSRITPRKLGIYRRHMRKLENWKDKVCPSGGVICKMPNGKAYKIIGAFGNIRTILNIFGDK